MNSKKIRPEITQKTYDEIIIISGVSIRSGLESALKQILKELGYDK